MALRFVVPFLGLLGRGAKKNGPWLVVMSLLLLLGQIVDLRWMILPALVKRAPIFIWSDLGPLFLLCGVSLLTVGFGLARYPALARQDPLLERSMRFELHI
jgi:hypothetical protein